MLRYNDITEALLHLVGWRQPYNPKDRLAEDLDTSESGLYFQDAHPLMTLDNIAAVVPDNFKLQYPDWNATTIYAKGAKVMHGNVVWIATEPNVNEEPPVDEWAGDYSTIFVGKWQAYNFFTDYLQTLTKNGIAQTVQHFIDTKKIQKENICWL